MTSSLILYLRPAGAQISDSLSCSIRWEISGYTQHSPGERCLGITNPDALAQLPTGTAQITQLQDTPGAPQDLKRMFQGRCHFLGNQQTIEEIRHNKYLINMPPATKILPR